MAIEKEIEILFLDNTGNPVGRVWSHKYGSVSTIRKGQLNFTFSSEAVEWIKSIVRSKIENQQALLLTFNPPNSEIEKIVAKSISRLEDYRTKIATLEGQVVPDVAPQLRG